MTALSVSSKHLRGLYHRLTVTLPAAEVPTGIARVDSAVMDDDPWQQELNKLRERAYQTALEQSQLRVVGEPEFTWVTAQPGADCIFTATVEVLPTVDLSGLDKLVIECPDTKVSDSDVSHALELLRDEHKIFESVQRPAQTGDRIVFDYIGSIDGNAFKGSAVDGASAIIGAGDTLDELDSALIGRSAGDTFTIPITFPDDYAESELRGKCAQFNIVIQTVSAPRLPEADATFVQKVGLDSGSLEQLRAQLRDRLEYECTQARHRYIRRQLSQGLLDAVPVEVPETLVGEEVQRIRQTFESNIAAGEEPTESLPEAPLEATAKRRLALSLILSELIKQTNIRLDESKVEEKLDELAVRYGEVESVKQRYRSDKQLMQNVRALVMEEAGFEAALEMVSKTSVNMNLDELLRLDHIEH